MVRSGAEPETMSSAFEIALKSQFLILKILIFLNIILYYKFMFNRK